MTDDEITPAEVVEALRDSDVIPNWKLRTVTAETVERLVSKLHQSDLNFDALERQNVSLQSRLDECRESCARAVAARDVATARLEAYRSALEWIAKEHHGSQMVSEDERIECARAALGGVKQCTYSVSCAGTFRCTLPEGHEGPHHKVAVPDSQGVRL